MSPDNIPMQARNHRPQWNGMRCLIACPWEDRDVEGEPPKIPNRPHFRHARPQTTPAERSPHPGSSAQPAGCGRLLQGRMGDVVGGR